MVHLIAVAHLLALFAFALSIPPPILPTPAPPCLDDLWVNEAHFEPYLSFPLQSQGFANVSAGTRVVVRGDIWYLFGRNDEAPTSACPSGVISVNVRSSVDKGATWGPYTAIAAPDGIHSCMYADGSAIFDEETVTWHYLVQMLAVGGKGGWTMAHFSCNGASPLRQWLPNPHNPVVNNGQLFAAICSGAAKHCRAGMGDEGTPEIVEKFRGEFYVTFHGYDYKRKEAARGVARTRDFVSWNTTGGDRGLSGDVMFSAEDCQWNEVPWEGKCIGSGQASILKSRSGYMYQVIEVADKELGCETGWNTQWWPLGLVRSKTYAPSPTWEQMNERPFVGGPSGGEPHVGCSIQYSSLWIDADNTTYFSFWDVSFHAADPSQAFSRWHVYRLVPGTSSLPMAWPGPKQAPPQPDCSTDASCKATCAGYASCPSDWEWYCCADTLRCSGQHVCSGTPGLQQCSCGPKGRVGGGGPDI